MNRFFFLVGVILFSSVISAVAIADVQTDRIIQEQSRLLYQYQTQLNQLKDEVDQLREQVQKTQYTLNQSTATMQKMQVKLDTLTTTPQNAKNTPKTASTANNLWKPSGNDEKDYNDLIQLILEGKESPALITDLKTFNQTYPNSKYQDNVYFWLGQLSYKFKQPEEASVYFAKVVKEYPNSTKAGLSLAKIGQILEEKGEMPKAKTVYQQVLTRYASQTDAVDYVNKRLQNPN